MDICVRNKWEDNKNKAFFFKENKLWLLCLQVAEGARARGVSKIIGVDVNPQKSIVGK